MRDVARFSESVKIHEPQASVFLCFLKIEKKLDRPEWAYKLLKRLMNIYKLLNLCFAKKNHFKPCIFY